MPNNVINRVKIEAGSALLDEILEAVKDDGVGTGSIDFQKVIPMPPELDIEEGSRSKKALEIYREITERKLTVTISDKDGGVNIEVSGGDQGYINDFSMKYLNEISSDQGLIELGRKCFGNITEHGFASWYDWRIANWGTKWNSCGYDDHPPYEPGSDVIEYDTAWSAANPVIKKLSEIYPAAVFHLAWADEDIGYNLGMETYQGGELTDSYYPIAGSAEAYRFAINLRDDRDCMVSKDGSDIVYTDEPDYKNIMLGGKNVLYTEKKLRESEVPEGMDLAYLHLSANGRRIVASTFSNRPAEVKFIGSILSKESLNIDRGQLRVVSENGLPDIMGEDVTIGEYLYAMEQDSHEQQENGAEMVLT
jgi:hypothetical protein